MPKRRKITRRDFMNGVAWGAAAGATLRPMDVLANLQGGKGAGPYPPALMGMRGAHPGSFEVAHSLAWKGIDVESPSAQTDSTYDLVVVGGGISGLAAAWLYRAKTSPDAKILILDNHDDFGGAAKRNEFDVDGKKLIGYGGSMTLEGPKHYSRASKKLIKDLAIDVERFYTYFDQGFYEKWKLENAIYFSKENYGVDRLVPDPFGTSYGIPTEQPLDQVIDKFPVSAETKKALTALVTKETDYLADMTVANKPGLLKKISYLDFLEKYAGVPKEGRDILLDKWKGIWALGWDALSALEGARLEMPGTFGMGLTYDQLGWEADEEPYIFHFPDGNAGVARALVRSLIPGSIPGKTMEDLVPAIADYSTLDRAQNNVRIRLSATAVYVGHTRDGAEVDVTYVKEGRVERVRGKHVILACNNRMIPYICKEVPGPQVEAIEWATRSPLVYINIALRNWRAFAETGFDRVYTPKAELMHSFTLDYPVSMGGYHFAKTPDDPIVIHGAYVPNVPGEGLNGREQFVAGRQKLYQVSFQEFEDDVYKQMSGAFSGTSFDAERDIAGITVNRWPHGYAYEYNELFDPPEYNRNNGPHVTGRAQIGCISIANSDASAYAYVDGAIDAAVRAVDEQVKLG